MGTCLFEIGRGKVDGDPTGGKMQTGILSRRPNTLPGFLHRCIGQTHDIEARQAVGNITFSHNTTAPDAADAQGMYTADQQNRPFSHFLTSYPILLGKAIFFCYSV